MIQIKSAGNSIIKEPLKNPFGFKGGYLTELWQSVCHLESESGLKGTGLGVQSVLWSDPEVFARYGEKQGNEFMLAMTEIALTEASHSSFETPLDLLAQLLPGVYAHGKKLTEMPDLRLTFALNALVCVDHAAWMLQGQEKASSSFMEIIPAEFHSALSHQHQAIASVPVISYGMSEEAVIGLLNEGYFLLKIKLGADPDEDGDYEKMLKWDKQRLSTIHQLAGVYGCSFTENGKVAYYLDANGRYPSKDYLMRFLDHADEIGALASILLFEEPFPEGYKVDVSDLPVRIAADESVHDLLDVEERIALGYGALALKPVAKTMSLSLQIAKLAQEKGIPCFCADLTANPLMVDWNKNLAARLAPIPGLKIGVLESNGEQNYRNWQQMKKHHPLNGASWIETTNGLFHLNHDFYENSGGVFQESSFYGHLNETKNK